MYVLLLTLSWKDKRSDSVHFCLRNLARQDYWQQYLVFLLHIKSGSGNVSKLYWFISVISETTVCLKKNVLHKCVLCAGSPITPNYADNTTSNVAPWCTCSASGNQRQQCTEFLDYFTNNICLSKSPMHSSDYYTHWSLICLYYNPVSSSEYCCNQWCEVIIVQWLEHYWHGYIYMYIITGSEMTEMHFSCFYN